MLSTLSEVSSRVSSIYSLNPRPAITLLVTGGGIQSIPTFLTVPGASACILSAEVPYAIAASQKLVYEYTSSSEESGCTRDKAVQLAKAAYLKCGQLLLKDNCHNINEHINDISGVLGVACTAALVSSIPKRGDHRCHVAVYSDSACASYSITLSKGRRDRQGEDSLCSSMILDAVLKHVGLPLPVGSVLLEAIDVSKDSSLEQAPVELVTSEVSLPRDPLANIYERIAKHVLYIRRSNAGAASASLDLHTNSDLSGSDKQPLPQPYKEFLCLEDVCIPEGSIIYPGSFNPLHEGHLALVKAALEHLEQQYHEQHATESTSTPPAFQPPLVVFEIGALNADKPPLPQEEIARRLAQFDTETNPLFRAAGVSNFAVSVTSEPLFLQKSYIFKGCHFLVGADTMVRLVNAKYYADKCTATGVRQSGSKRVMNMVAALTSIAENGCRFIVGGRTKSATTESDATFETFESIMRQSYAEITGEACSVGLTDTTVEEFLPAQIAAMFCGLSERQFRLDLSSTELRNRKSSSADV